MKCQLVNEKLDEHAQLATQFIYTVTLVLTPRINLLLGISDEL